MKGHHALAEKVRGRTASYIGHRHATRLLSDFYGKGVVRSAQEAANLRAYADARDVTAAESIKTAMTATRAQETHNFLYQHTSHSQEIGSVTQAQLETIYSPAASPAISRGQTPQEHRRGSKAKGYEGGARTYSQDYGAGGGDEVIGILGTVKGAIGESKAAEGDRLGPLEDHDSISESLAFLSLCVPLACTLSVDALSSLFLSVSLSFPS